MIDLTYLTEEEQDSIRAVLNRDAVLKKVEEQRIHNLQRSVSDQLQLKYLTGEWFYETKQLRHRDRIHGCDIIRTSMRHTQRPLTTQDLCQTVPERLSFFCSENKEVFVPPVLCGLLQEPQMQPSTDWSENQTACEPGLDPTKPLLRSPTKRKNPFNSEVAADKQDDYLLDGEFCQTQTGDDNCPSEMSVPTKRHSAADWQDVVDLGRPTLLDTYSAFTHESSHSPGCSSESELQQQNGNMHLSFNDVFELCELELKDTVEPCYVFAEQNSGKTVHLKTVSEDSQMDDLEKDIPEIPLSHPDCFNNPCHFVSRKTTKGLFGIFSKEKSDQEEENTTKKDELTEGENLLKSPPHSPVDKAMIIKQHTLPVKTAEVKMLQLAALYKTPFKDTLSSVDLNIQEEVTETFEAPFPHRQSHRKTLREEENSTSRLILMIEEVTYEDKSKSELTASHITQMSSDVTKWSPDMKIPEEDVGEESPQTSGRFLVDQLHDEGSYRANPILICEETDESLEESVTDIQTYKPEETIFSEVLGTPSPCSSPPSSTLQVERSTSIIELKNFWEREITGPKIITVKVKDAWSTSALPQSKLVTSSDTREELEEVKQASETITAEVQKLRKVSDPGPDTYSLYRSTNDSKQAKTQTESVERSWSPAKEHLSSANDHDDVRISPSKTCHPKVLPPSSSKASGSRLKGSPLKTFLIDIDPHTKVNKQQQEKVIPAPKQMKSPSHGAKTMLADQGTDISSPSGPPQLEMFTENGQQNGSKSFNSPKSKQVSQETSVSFTHLARSFIPHDFQYYLGPEEKTHALPFNEGHASAESEDTHRLQRACRQSASDSSEMISTSITSFTVRTRNNSSNQDVPARSSSLPWTATESYSDHSSSIMLALKRISSRSMSSAKSLERITLQTEGKNRNEAREELNLSIDDVSSPPSCEQMRSSMSVPVFHQDETDSDSTFETTTGYRRNTSSSTSNISISSGMASMSSVSGSINSIYPGDFPEVDVQGSIQFAVNYIQKLEEFHIFVVLCRGLAIADSRKSRSDPYVKCYLLPDKTKLGKRKTTVKKKTLNPTYNEILRFRVLMEVLKTQILSVSVWHNDMFGRNSFLGEVDLDLSEWDFSNTQINDYSLKARVLGQTSSSHLTDSRGQMRVALRFLPQTSHSKRTQRMEAGEVQIWIKDCKNLPPVRGIIIDPFVKCAVLPDTSRKSRQKTRVVKRTANPMFNHTMVYDGFRPEDLREACAEITVWDHDRLNNHYIGGLRLGLGTGKSYGVEVTWMDSSPDEAALWRRMLQANGEWVEAILPLRMLVMAKNM